tara:strand:+ start:1752 stop:2024 length:273 start_codon:yes stop_codon:yes gene_type:complete
MALQDFLGKLRPYKSVLKRTRPKNELPTELLYIDWLSGESKRKLLDVAGNEHVLTDKILQSNYKLSTGAAAKALIKEHWAEANPHTAETE